MLKLHNARVELKPDTWVDWWRKQHAAARNKCFKTETDFLKLDTFYCSGYIQAIWW